MLNVLTTHDGRSVPTLAGLLTFGLYPQTFEPQLDLTFVAYPTAEPGVLGAVGERFTENRSIDGPIPAIVAECIRVLKRVEFPNHTLLDEATLSWLGSLETTPLTRAQMTALALMRSGVVVNNSSYRASTGVQDSRAATRELRELVDAGVIEQSGSRGTATYQLAAAHRLRGTEASQTEAFSYPLNDNEAKILGLLDGVELSRAEIIERSGLTKDQVLYALQSLRKKQRVTLKGQQRSRSALWTASR